MLPVDPGSFCHASFPRAGYLRLTDRTYDPEYAGVDDSLTSTCVNYHAGEQPE